MKKVILFLLLIVVVITAQAREPYGDYVCRYIVESGRYYSINNPIKITHYGIQVKKHKCRNQDVEGKLSGTNTIDQSRRE